MVEVFEGRCQCGEVQFRIEGTSIALFACHCTECQRQSSSAFGMALWIEDFQKSLLTGTPESWTRVMPSGKHLIGDFCAKCGTRLFHQVSGQSKVMSIKPGTLTATKWLDPVAHIWTASAQPWIQFPPDVLTYPGNPPDYVEITKAWQHRKTQTSLRSST